VPKIAGEMSDRLDIHITNCQTGYLKGNATIHITFAQKKTEDKIITMLEELRKDNEPICANVFELALRLKLTPMAIADVANFRNLI